MVLVCEASNGREAIQQFRTQIRLRKQVCWSDAYLWVALQLHEAWECGDQPQRFLIFDRDAKFSEEAAGAVSGTDGTGGAGSSCVHWLSPSIRFGRFMVSRRGLREWTLSPRRQACALLTISPEVRSGVTNCLRVAGGFLPVHFGCSPT